MPQFDVVGVGLNATETLLTTLKIGLHPPVQFGMLDH